MSLLVLLTGCATPGGPDSAAARATLQASLPALCAGPEQAARVLTAAFADAHPLAAAAPQTETGERRYRIDRRHAVAFRWQGAYAAGEGESARGQARLERWRNDAWQPVALALVLGDCRVAQWRVIEAGAAGTPLRVAVYDGQQRRRGTEALNPPLAPGVDPGGVLVGLIDTGVDYTLSQIAARLARNGDGTLIGYDAWDEDSRPYDAETSASPFFPRRHGTGVASVLLREAQEARLAVYRYPQPDLDRFGEVIARAYNDGVRLLGVALSSDDPNDWQSFAQAVRTRPDLLVVAAAGNQGQDIDHAPIYPAALPLANLITVTAGDATGEALAVRANWGRQSVDLVVPATAVPILNEGGRRRTATGASYAMPRVLALLARLRAVMPDASTQALQQALFARAQPFTGAGPVRHGVIFAPDALIPRTTASR